MNPSSPHWILGLGATVAGLAVALGAFGAHGLQQILAEKQLQTFDTASRYLMVHGLAIVALGLALSLRPQWLLLKRAALLLLIGISVFSGSLYILCLSDLTWIAWLTPVGGTLLIIGWGYLAVGAFRGH